MEKKEFVTDVHPCGYVVASIPHDVNMYLFTHDDVDEICSRCGGAVYGATFNTDFCAGCPLVGGCIGIES